MNRNPLPAELHLAHRALFTIDDAAGVDVACSAGTLWITLDDDSRDIVLEAGGRFSTQDHRRAVIYAMEDSDLTIRTGAAEPTPLRARQQFSSGARVSHA